MTKSMTSVGVRAALILALVTAAACGEDTLLTPTFGDGCTRGTLTAGDTVTGAFNPGSCIDNINFYTWSPSPYESWRVTLQEGKGYLFYMGHSTDSAQGWLDNADPVLALFGESQDGFSVPLGVSDDEADTYNSALFFVAPRSGTFNLVAASYSDQDLGGYTLSMTECPVLATLDTAGMYILALPLGAARCSRPGHPAGGAPLSYAFLRVPTGTSEDLTVEVSSGVFPAAGEIFGVGFDTYGNLYSGGDYAWFAGNDDPIGISTGAAEGIATLAVGTNPATAGTFSVRLDRVSLVAPPAIATRATGAPVLRTDRPAKQPR